jgi:CDP-diacylglycerol--glycerol-3-phosphate 3-phosphatidyltransferase
VARFPSIEQPTAPNAALTQLRQGWRRLALLTVVALLLGFAVLRAVWRAAPALRWLGLAGLTAAALLTYLKGNLTRNRAAAADPIYDSLGPATVATLTRGLLIAAVGGFLFSPRPPGGLSWAPAIAFPAAMLLDLLDGYLARRFERETQLGETFDVALDRLGVLIGSSLAVWYQVLPWPFLFIGFAGYLFELGRWARLRSCRPVRALPPSDRRRPIAGLMMGYLSAVLWPIVTRPAATLAGLFFLVPFLATFARDWLVISGWLDPAGERYRRARSLGEVLLLRWFPMPARAVAALSLAAGVSHRASRLDLQVQVFRQAGLPFGQAAVQLFLILEGIGAALLALGIAGRAMAIVLLFPLGFTIVAGGLTPELALSLSGVLAVLILGTGAFSLWRPEARFFGRRPGAPSVQERRPRKSS